MLVPLTVSRNRKSSSPPKGKARPRSRVWKGRVVRGDGLGRELGFPTANIDLPAARLPPFGIYLARLRSPLRGRFALASVGVRPTLGRKNAPRLEIYIPDFAGNLYGRTLAFELVLKLRDEKKYPSLGALKAGIRLDLRRFRALSRKLTAG